MKTVSAIVLGHVAALEYRRVSHEWLDTRQVNNERNNASYRKMIRAANITKQEHLHFLFFLEDYGTIILQAHFSNQKPFWRSRQSLAGRSVQPCELKYTVLKEVFNSFFH